MIIEISDYRNILTQSQQEHRVLTRKLSVLMEEKLKGYGLRRVKMFNLQGDPHRHKVGEKLKEIAIFYHSTLEKEDGEYNYTVDEKVIINGKEYDYKEFLQIKGNETLILSDNGIPLATWDKEAWQLNILFKVFSSGSDKEIEVFEFIIDMLVELELKEIANMSSWKYAKDKEELSNQLDRIYEEQQEEILRTTKRNISETESAIVDFRSRLKSAIVRLTADRKALEAMMKNGEGLVDKIKKDLDLIVQHEKIKDVRLESGKFIVFTKELFIHSSNSKKYYGGEYKIYIDMRRSMLRFENDKNAKKGFWTSRDPHPHVNGSNGEPCLGNLNETVAELSAGNELYALTLIAIDFLESANVSDTAGEHVRNWDEVDENGKKINEDGQTKLCDHCGRPTDESDLTLAFEGIEESDEELYGAREVCEECLEEHYSYDDEEEEYILD